MSKEKCQGKDRNGDRCRNYPAEGMTFCKRAHLYLVDYTPEQLANLRFCKGCNKWKDLPVNKNQCVECAIRGKTNREESRATVVLCKAVDCTFKKSDDNDYCGKHQLCVFVDECKAQSVRPCRRYLHGCREKLSEDYNYTACHKCLELEREQDNVRRGKVDPSIVSNSNKQCTTCRAWKPLSDYTNRNNSNITLTCLNCRDNNAIANANRDVEHRREQERIASQKPERKATKKAWEEANPEKVALKTLNYRNRQHSENQEEYLRRNADNMKKWRENNPERTRELIVNQNNKIHTLYRNYQYRSTINKRSFNLTIEQFESIVKDPCYYCKELENNGIDRQDHTIGYELDNCVSCCETCNMLKGCLDNITFTQRIYHILNINKFPEAFANHGCVSFNEYKKRAQRKQIDFQLSESEYKNLIQGKCYICKKESSDIHTNGIDRVDNKLGYITSNVKTCCAECNYMKKDMDYEKFMGHLSKILKWIPDCNKQRQPSVRINTHIKAKETKMTKKELKEFQDKTREERRKKMREKYADPVFKATKAKEFANNK